MKLNNIGHRCPHECQCMSYLEHASCQAQRGSHEHMLLPMSRLLHCFSYFVQQGMLWATQRSTKEDPQVCMPAASWDSCKFAHILPLK